MGQIGNRMSEKKGNAMILAVDVAYRKDGATLGGILFHDWHAAVPSAEFVVNCPAPEKYLPGQFCRRELPCISLLLKRLPGQPDCIVIDGFVDLGRNREPGLGRHLFNMLQGKVAIIGVAKSPYRDSPRSCKLLRGSSRKPLYVTGAGIPQERAKLLIKGMHGPDRIPTLLRYVDRLSRGVVPC